MRTWNWTAFICTLLLLLSASLPSPPRVLGEEGAAEGGAPDPLSIFDEARLTPEEYRRFLDGLAQARPMPMPDVDPALIAPDSEPGLVIAFDPETGRSRSFGAAADSDSPRLWPGSPGTPLEGIPPGGSDGLDSGHGDGGCTAPSQACSTHDYPWRTVVKLLMRFRVGTTDYFYVCSAATVSSFHLITAGHCIFNWDPDNNGNTSDARWADEVWAWPAQTDLVNPFGPVVAGAPVEEDYPWGVAKAAWLYSYTGWTQSQDLNHDMGYIRLDRRIGDRVGWMGAEAGVQAASLNFDGYPTETPYVPAGVICPYPGYDANNVNSYTTYRISMCAFTYGGHSGGPVWRLTGSSRYIQGVNSTSNRNGSATATRLTTGKFADLYDTIIPDDESNNPPTARPELIEYVFDNSSKDVLDNSVPQGTSFQIEYNVFNVGFASSGTITVDFYLSLNTNITTGDYLIGTTTLSSLAANTYYNPTTTRTVPCSVPTGTYYVGYIFSCTGTEYNNDNNVVVIADETVTVTSGLPGTTALVSPANGATCQPTSVLLDWNAASQATGYQVQIGTACGSGTTYSTSATSYTVTGLANNTTYYWRVRSTNACGNGSWSSCRSFSVTPATPGVAARVSPANGANCQPTSLTLDWSDVTNATAYEVQIGTSCGTGTTYSPTASQQAVSGLASNETYYWRARARNACGTFGSWSGCRTFTTTPTPPAVATLLAPTNGGDCLPTASVVLDWSDVSSATGYQVQVGTSCGAGTTTSTTSSTHTLTNLASGVTYYWRVRAANACGTYGSWSGCWTFTTTPAPPAVANLLAPDDGACTGTTVGLDWADVPGAVRYEVQIGGSCGTGPTTVVPVSEYTAMGLAGGTHYWRVRALDSCAQWGNWSGCRTFIVDTVPPTNPVLSSPSHTTSTWSNDSTVDATWSGASDNCGIRGYSYLWDTSPGTVPDTDPEGPETSTTSPALPDGQNHYFHLRTVDLNNNWSGAVHLGPFWIDTTPPGNPATVSSPSHTPSTWSNDNTVAAVWPAAVDPLASGGSKIILSAKEKMATLDKQAYSKVVAAMQSRFLGSGIRGYSYDWDTNPTTLPDATVDTDQLQTTSPPLADGQLHYFHLRAIDQAGNPAVGALHMGPFWIDATPPTAVLLVPNGGEVWRCGEVRTISWNASDAGSGLQSIELRYSTDSGATFPHLIANPPAAASTYDWTVPPETSPTAMVQVIAVDLVNNSRSDRSDAVFELDCSSAGTPEVAEVPVTSFEFGPNVPNPFNPSTVIPFAIPHDTRVDLAIFDLDGRRVRTLVQGERTGPNRYQAVWDGRDETGRSMASGVYFYRLETPEFRETRRLTLLK